MKHTRTTSIVLAGAVFACTCATATVNPNIRAVQPGDHTGQGGGTNTMKLLSVGEDGIAESLRDL